MAKGNWTVVYEAAGDFQAEILRGLLEAQGIEAWISQEGAGRAYQVGIGRLGKAEILVQESESQRAREILDEYLSGAYEQDDLNSQEEPGTDPDA